MKPEFKVEGDVLIISAGLATGIDNDGDGVKSVEVGGNIVIKLDGSEVADELVKSSSFVAKFKEKLGLN